MTVTERQHLRNELMERHNLSRRQADDITMYLKDNYKETLNTKEAKSIVGIGNKVIGKIKSHPIFKEE